MKNFLSVLSSALQGGIRGGILILALFATTSLWAYDYDFEHNEIRYKIISDEVANRTVEVVGSYTNYATHFTIPQTVIHGAAAYEVIRIGDEAFDNHKTIAVIELPNSITSIGYKAFYNSTLKEIVIPESVTDIEEYAFGSCYKLTSVTIGDGVMSIGTYAFYDCSSLTSITIPNSVTSIENNAFKKCSSLTSITIPNSVTNIGLGAFSFCSSLKSVIWDAKNIVSASKVFEESPIETITFTDNVETIPAGICYNMSSLTSVSIGNSVMRIEGSAFYGCKFLASITLPNTLTSIERQAFSNCPSLSSITIPESVTNLEYDAFYKCYFAADNFVNYSSQQSFGGAIIVDADINGLLITDSTLVKCRPNVVSAEVPEGVKSIESSAFKESPLLTTITIGNDVKTIGANAFENCEALTSVVITDSVQTINDKAFLNCTSLSSVSISDATTYIGRDAFAGTTWFDNKPDGVVYINSVLYKYKGTMPANTSVTIKDGTLFISPSAFDDCSSLVSVTIPNGVLGIGGAAFYGCSLTEITIPYSVLLVQTGAFDHCYSLSSVKWNAKGIPNVPPEYTGGGMPSLGDGWIVGGFNYTNIFNEGSYVTSFVFGDSVKHIPANLCKYMEGLRSVTLPKSVATIGEKAFFGCSSLTEITIPENVTYMANFAFGNCPALSSVTWNAKKCRDFYYNTVGNSTGGTPNSYPFYNEYITSLTFGDSVEYIPAFLCYKMDEITTINIPNSIDSIGEYAFSGCSSLTSAIIGNSVTNIGNRAFSGCSSLTSLTIPNRVTSIGDGAFSGCSSLTSITIPDSITSIGEDAFYGCSSLTSITIPNSVTNIGNSAFYRCSSLTSITIPNSVTSIGDHAFYDCSSLVSVVWNATNYTSDAYYVFDSDTPYQITSFVFGDSVKYIPSCLCGGMSSLTSITIPNSVTSIGDKAFSGCSSLSSITIPNSVTSIGEYAFRGCESLSSVVIGNSVTKIRTETFKDCSSLTSVTIGKKVKEIGADAFYDCSALAQTNYTGDIAGWCQIAFEISKFGGFSSNPTYYSKNLFINGEEVKDVVIPNTVTSISSRAFYNCEKISSLTISESVKSIGYNAFAGCKKLFDIYCYPTTPPEAQENSFTNYNVNLYVPCESLKDYQMDMVFGSFKYIQCLEDTPPSEPQDTTIYSPTEGIGVFSVGEGKTVTFSRGNLQYTQSTNTWSFAENQWGMIGTDNVIGGSVSSDSTYGDEKSGNALVDKIDLFGWSTSTTNFGVSTSTSKSDYSSSFVDWGTNQIGADVPNTWRTLTYEEWYYLSCERPNYSELYGVAQVNGVNGLVFLPDNWTCPSGVTFKSGFHSSNGVEYYAAYQTFTADQWSKFEAAGAVFLPAAGERSGSNVYRVQCSGSYWSATENNSRNAYCRYFYSGGAYMFSGNCDNGHSVRLVKDVNSTTPEPPVEPEPEVITITLPVDTATICEYETYTWHGNEYNQPGAYTVTEIVEEEDYIYHIIYTLELTVLPSETKEFFHNVMVCSNELPYYWWVNGEYGQYEVRCEKEGIYQHFENQECSENIYTLHLTVHPSETIETEVEAYDSYEWHGVVYTESGVYTYQDPYYPCVIEILHLTIIPSEDNQGEVVVEPSTNSVTITWQKEDDADTYIIVIKQGDKVVCTLIFDAEGNLVSVNYLPSRESNKHGIQHAGLTSDSFQYTITGLTPSTDYTYTVTATDDSNNTISSYSGEFTTHHATSVENTNSQSPTSDCQKILYEDHIYILRDGKIYSIMGQEM